MEITIENTSKIVMLKPGVLLDGVPARIWEGKTASGIEVICFVTRIMVKDTENAAEFENELQACKAPSTDVESIPTRLIL